MRHTKNHIYIFVHDSTYLCIQFRIQVLYKARNIPLVKSIVRFKLLYFVTLYF